MESALTPIAWIVVGYAVVVTVLAGLGAGLRAPRPRWLDQMAWMLEVLSAVFCLGALGAFSGADRPESVATYLGYLAAGVLLVPVGMTSVRGDRGPWASGVIAVAALATGVVVVRVMMLR